MTMKFTLLLGAAITAFCLVGQQAQAQLVIVNDTFDDGDLGTNATGTGDGLNTFVAGGGSAIDESGGSANMTLPTNGGRRANFTTKDGASVNSTVVSTFEINEVNLPINVANTGTGNTDRLYFGVRANSSAADVGNPQEGFWIQIESDSLVTGTGNGDFSNGISSLFYQNSAGARNQLASFTFDSMDFTLDAVSVTNPNPLSFVFELTADTYDVTIGGDTISNITGSLSGNFTHGMTTGFASWAGQTENPGLDITVGEVVIETDIGILGDFNGINGVDVADFQILADNLAGELDGSVGYPQGDIDFDGDVDLDDFGQFKDLFPAVVAAATGVPEPSTAILLLFGAFGLACRRR
ncbi:PEP-CTERM sorting domain-containing protein [Adhaeretor mobilis]|uniref:Ice-binding protein C-terminal domain-containing protein n=1 Tax=Adhaeretor mobilis TaxID=1930276 RepID=A0A517MXI7_9BACT|nr:PEP-CTERM sorting domain-containing protein [Adhaeretor mobilis]QDS99573.1 hypothetical protein HG15A2_28980 [Adhaeretor mobilis]